MKITILSVGKIKEEYWNRALEEYTRRLGRYCKPELAEVDDEPTPENASLKQEMQIREREGERRGDRARVGVADRDRRGDARVEAVDRRVDVERVDGTGLVGVLEGDLDPGGGRFRPGQSLAIRTHNALRDGEGGKESGEEEGFHWKVRGGRCEAEGARREALN